MGMSVVMMAGRCSVGAARAMEPNILWRRVKPKVRGRMRAERRAREPAH